jgi:hypothetical protein
MREIKFHESRDQVRSKSLVQQQGTVNQVSTLKRLDIADRANNMLPGLAKDWLTQNFTTHANNKGDFNAYTDSKQGDLKNILKSQITGFKSNIMGRNLSQEHKY